VLSSYWQQQHLQHLKKTFMKKKTFTLTNGERFALLFIFSTMIASLAYAIPVFSF
jgi:cell division protein FtsL